MIDLKSKLKKEYLDWSMKKINFEANQDFIKIETPFVDPSNDYINLFLEQKSTHYILSDDGYAVDELDSIGVDVFKQGKRKDFFNKTLRTFGVSFNSKTYELFIEFDDLSSYPVKQHMLIQCIIRINDMLLTTRNKTANFFSEDLQEFLLDNDLSITPNAQFIGKTGNTISFDFAIGMTKKSNQKLIKAVANPRSEAYVEPLFSFLDLDDSSRKIDKIIIADDEANKVSKIFASSITNFSSKEASLSNMKLYLWSKRSTWIKELKSS
ncbi:DUF1828 domain-containing protein [Listeria aquatica]|uniref:DUF1828 domain-containing protein n=1 Tax=Listeria aquatica FSL S10-1188 TaxID=1265818 RepID=W7B7X8_9LIST|nr:DUF1828 domain-containing protein [Listeria aquatica]EUJ18971.1 hypothetical protein MAQA_07743 [Listeria aquatica FSL S10-1188]